LKLLNAFVETWNVSRYRRIIFETAGAICLSYEQNIQLLDEDGVRGLRAELDDREADQAGMVLVAYEAERSRRDGAGDALW